MILVVLPKERDEWLRRRSRFPFDVHLLTFWNNLLHTNSIDSYVEERLLNGIEPS